MARSRARCPPLLRRAETIKPRISGYEPPHCGPQAAVWVLRTFARPAGWVSRLRARTAVRCLAPMLATHAGTWTRFTGVSRSACGGQAWHVGRIAVNTCAMHVTKSILLSLSLGSLLVAGCQKSNTDTVPPEPAVTTPPEPTPEPEPAAAADADAPAATPAPPPPPPPLADGESVAVAKAANDGEIETSKLAKTMAKDKKVKDFAAMMVKDHTAANKRHAALIKKAKIEAKDSELSNALTADAKTRVETLKGTEKGAAFDKAYIDAQVEMHTAVLSAIDTRMMPGVQNPDLKAELATTRAAVESHLNQVKEIQTALAAAPDAAKAS